MSSPSPVTIIINHLSTNFCHGIVGAGIGYLCSRAFVQLNQRAAIACGAMAGLITGLFFASGSNIPSKIVGLAALIFVPFRVCLRHQLPIQFKQALAIVAVTAASLLIVNYLYNLSKEKNSTQTIVRNLNV